jgi:Mrp family chromosome partitioning ATPase
MSSDCKNCTSESCSARNKLNNESEQEFIDRQLLSSRMCKIKHKILVLSGKGGVGKSTVAANLAIALSKRRKVGIVDIDIHGPSVPTIFNITYPRVSQGENERTMLPIEISDNLKAMSIGFLLSDSDDALIWRGPMKIGVIKQFLKDVEWGELDYLIADLPPGTGDEPLSICQMIEDINGAVIVTTPQEMALADVRKSINFCRKVKVPIIGVIENMSGFKCPECGKVTDIFKKGGAEEMCFNMGVPFLGRIPLTPEIVIQADAGSFHSSESEVTELFKPVIERIVSGND